MLFADMNLLINFEHTSQLSLWVLTGPLPLMKKHSCGV